MRIWKTGVSSFVELEEKRRSVLGLKYGVRAWLKCALGAKLSWDVWRDSVVGSLTGIKNAAAWFHRNIWRLISKQTYKQVDPRSQPYFMTISFVVHNVLPASAFFIKHYVSIPQWIEKDEDIGTDGENKLLTIECNAATEISHLDQNPLYLLDLTRFPSSRLHFLPTRFIETRSQWAGARPAAVPDY
jgi:hypothetical protein